MKIAKDCPFCGEDIGPVVARQGTKYTFYQVMHQPNKKGHRHGLIIMDVDEWNNRPIEDELRARIAELEAENDILKDHLREAKNILIDKNLQIDSLYEEGYKLQQRIAELEAENAALKAEPKPLAYWSDEKKQTYADNEGRSAKRSEE